MTITSSAPECADEGLRLAVLDDEDLAVVSAHLQDAEAQLADMAYLPRQKCFALILSRFDRPLAAKGRCQRCRTGLHFERVLKVARSGLNPKEATVPRQLLAITFKPVDSPSGDVLLTFAGGAQIRLSVECLEAEMRDLGPRWDAPGQPAHPDMARA
jgi:hypothetical protein